MKKVSKVLYRAYQSAFRAAMPVLPYREPQTLCSVRAVGGLLESLKKKCALIVTGRTLSGMGALNVLEASLQKSGIAYTVYNRTSVDPTPVNVEEAREMYLDAECDTIIAFGGGSAIDCAKAVGARIAYPERSLDDLKGLLKVKRAIPTLIAIPTTAGTGSEATVTAVITDQEKMIKYTMNSFSLIPKFAVLDPEVTLTMPRSLTATTGMDALTHAVEAYIGRSTTAKTRAMCLEATKLIFANLRIAANDGMNREARGKMLRASYLAGCAFTQSYVGYIHAVAHTLGGRYGIPHGLANAVLMPIVLEAYGECAYKKLHELGIAAGVADHTDEAEVGARKFILAIRELSRELGIPESLSGIKIADIPELASYAEKEANPLYPVPRIMDAEELEHFYFKVMDKKDRKSIASC